MRNHPKAPLHMAVVAMVTMGLVSTTWGVDYTQLNAGNYQEYAAWMRYRIEGKSEWQEGMFRSISARGLIFADHADAPLDTLPLAALNAVELDRGMHVEFSRVLFFPIMGILAGGLVARATTESRHCETFCLPLEGLIGAGVGAALGLAFALIPVRDWERVHGEQPRRTNPWSSRDPMLNIRF